jgi:hypothetical protein
MDVSSFCRSESESPKSPTSDWAKELVEAYSKVRSFIAILREFHEEEWSYLVQLGKHLIIVQEDCWTKEFQVADDLYSVACKASFIKHGDLLKSENRCLFRNMVLEFCMNEK